MLIPVLASALVGGIIGYTTNWLAIRMLFRPLTEKYIGKWRLPFTPGLIPKKRAVLAESLGNTVANYLVTTETLVAAVGHPQFEANLEGFISEIWIRFSSEQCSLADLLQTAELTDHLAALPKQLAEQLLQVANDSAWLKQVVRELRMTLLTKPEQAFPRDELGDCVSSILKTLLANVNLRNRFFGEVDMYLEHLKADENRRLADVLPLAVQEQIHNLILTDSPNWFDWIHKLLQEPNNRALVQALIQEFLTGSTVLRLMSAFADTGKLADSLVQSLTRDEVRTQITGALLTGWEQLLTQRVARIAAKIDGAELREKLQQASSGLLQPSQLAGLRGMLYRSIKSEDGQIAGDQELTLQVEQLAQQALELVIQSPGAKRWLTELVHGLLARLLQYTPADLLADKEFLLPSRLAPRLQAWLTQATKKHGSELLTALRLTDVVEAQVNALDIVQVEDILLQIVQEQLTAITNLGFVLGAVIGSVMPFINALLGS